MMYPSAFIICCKGGLFIPFGCKGRCFTHIKQTFYRYFLHLSKKNILAWCWLDMWGCWSARWALRGARNERRASAERAESVRVRQPCRPLPSAVPSVAVSGGGRVGQPWRSGRSAVAVASVSRGGGGSQAVGARLAAGGAGEPGFCLLRSASPLP